MDYLSFLQSGIANLPRPEADKYIPRFFLPENVNLVNSRFLLATEEEWKKALICYGSSDREPGLVYDFFVGGNNRRKPASVTKEYPDASIFHLALFSGKAYQKNTDYSYFHCISYRATATASDVFVPIAHSHLVFDVEGFRYKHARKAVIQYFEQLSQERGWDDFDDDENVGFFISNEPFQCDHLDMIFNVRTKFAAVDKYGDIELSDKQSI